MLSTSVRCYTEGKEKSKGSGEGYNSKVMEEKLAYESNEIFFFYGERGKVGKE